MSIEQIQTVLHAHDVATRVHRGQLQAADIYQPGRRPGRWARKWADLTGWTRSALMQWLGY